LKKVAVVILNWNGRKFLKKFLPSVIKYSQDNCDIIIADNASTDSSIEFLHETYPQIRIIQNLINGGFAKGYNDAFKKVEAEYYVLLNSDIEVTSNWINPVIELMDKDPTIAACQPKLRSYDHPEMFEYAVAAGGFIDKYAYPFCRGRLFQTIEKDVGQYDDITEIFWATGACMFVRANLYHKFGGLDEDFFAHMEEIDFCWRLKNAGYKIMYCPQSIVYHVGGGTLPKVSSHKTYLNMRNNITMLYKNLPNRLLVKVFIIRLFLDGIAAFKFLIDSGFKDFIAVIHAHISFYAHLKLNLKKRQKIKHARINNIYTGNIVIDYFFRKKRYFSELENSKFD
jgi:GT2 family glycosyltransferase